MTVSSIGSSSYDLSALTEHLRAVKKGEANLTKDDVTQIQSVLSEDNPASQLLNNFDSIDTDADGTLSALEFQTYAEVNGLQVPERQAGRGGGKPPGGGEPPDKTKEELTAMRDDLAAKGEDTTALDAAISNYDEADENQDGVVSFTEFQAFAKANGLQLPGDGVSEGSNGLAGSEEPPALSKDDLASMQEQLSSTDSEAAAGLASLVKNFDSADTDQDGKISKAEFETFASANGISMPKPPPPPADGLGNSAQTSSAASSASLVDAASASSSDNSTSLVQALLQSIMQKYSSAASGAQLDYNSLLKGVEA